jgi:hypothetical protein
MTALVIISLFYLFMILVCNKKGMTFYLANKNWLLVSIKLVVAASLGLLVFNVYGKFQYSLIPDLIVFESSSSRMLFFTMWILLTTKGINQENQPYQLSGLFAGLLFFVSNFTTFILLIGLIVSFLPKSQEKNKAAVRIIYLLLSILIIIQVLETPFFSTVDGILLTLLTFSVLLRFNYDHQEESFSMFPSFMWALVGCVPFLESIGGVRIFMERLIAFSILGALLLIYEIVMRKRSGVFGLVPSISMILIPSFFEFGIISNVALLIPLFWYFLLVEDESKIELTSVNKINVLIILFCLGLSPFTPGGWSLNMLLNEIGSSPIKALSLIIPFFAILIVIYYGLEKAFKTVKKDPIVEDAEAGDVIDLLLTVLITSFMYYATLPDIFSESNAFKFLVVLEKGSVFQAQTPWRTKNLIFMSSIFIPLLVFGWVYWKQTKLSQFDEVVDKYKLKIQGFIIGRLPFFEEGMAVKSHLISVNVRNRSELILRGMLFSPTVFAFEAIGTLGAYLGRMRPKGINSNLLYTIIVTAFVLIFYLRKLL